MAAGDPQVPTGTDQWADWLERRRYGGDPEGHRRTLEFLTPVRDRVLRGAALVPGASVLDVGCGDGLIAFGALDLVGPHGRVVFSDVSAALLERCRALAADTGVLQRCGFVQAPAHDLSQVGDASVHAVTLRSVLIYETQKARAFEEFHRVLRPGGRLSIFEPVNRFGHPEPPDRFHGYDVGAVAEIASKLRAAYERRQPSDTNPMLDFDERDLVDMAERAGFCEVHAQLDLDVQPWGDSSWRMSWEAMLHSAFNPLAPTLAEAMAEALTPEESDHITAHLRPLVEGGRGEVRRAATFLWAVR